MIALDAALDAEFPVLPVLFVMPLATTLNVYDVPETSPAKPHELVPKFTRAMQLPVRPADGVGVTRYDAMAALAAGVAQDTVTSFGFPV
jgi:hypothetical protein